MSKLLWTIWLLSGCAFAQGLPLEKLTLPKGFHISVYASDVKNARQMALGDKGTLFVGSRSAGNVYALIDNNGDFKADEMLTIASGLNMPSGIAFHQGNLYIGEVHRVIRYNNIENHLRHPGQPDVVINNLPRERHHGWKYLGFGPDGQLYVPVGAPCNICLPDKNHGAIFRYNIHTGQRQVVARGVRNSVGFDWQPGSQDLWFSDNGRDMLGDDIPPDEINHVTAINQHFGYPYVHGGTILDPQFGKGKNPADYRPPAINVQAHSATLGIHFYRGKQFPARYHNGLFIAEHGSWNRSKKVGYRISFVSFKAGKVKKYQAFIQGWLRPDESVWGRPDDILELADGSLLIADDFANAIYRVTYQP